MPLPGYEQSFGEGTEDNYTIAELGQFIHLFVKRAAHRLQPEKRDKDLLDARNYWRLLGERLDRIEAGRDADRADSPDDDWWKAKRVDMP